MPYLPIMLDWAADIRQIARSLFRRPGFALLAILTLAVAMSVNSVAFSVVNAILFKRPAFAEPDRLGWLFTGAPGNPLGQTSVPEYETLRTGARTLDAIIAEGRLPLRLRDGNRTTFTPASLSI